MENVDIRIENVTLLPTKEGCEMLSVYHAEGIIKQSSVCEVATINILSNIGTDYYLQFNDGSLPFAISKIYVPAYGISTNSTSKNKVVNLGSNT